MIGRVRKRVSDGLRGAVRELYDLDLEESPAVEDPPRPDMGDLASPLALQLAKRLGRNPREVAQQIVDHLESVGIAGVERWGLAGPGFLNAWLDRGGFLFDLASDVRSERAAEVEAKVLVEHTSINPNKAAHIGHLRNACMGDTLARLFRDQGHPVEVHNYIDDTGVQVADVVIGFLDVRGMDAEEVATLPEPFDYLCWDLYTEVSERLSDDEKLQARRREVLLALEEDSGPEAEMARLVAARIVGRHLLTMERLEIRYDLLVKEGDILALDLWSEAFDKLKSSPAVFHADQGKHEGCWMMRLSGVEGFTELEDADKVLVRSNGVATYVAKDIAYHLWKYGLLERDFQYERVEGAVGAPAVWQTTREDGERMPFGHADRAVTVIDVRQSYLQAVVAQAFSLIGQQEAGESLTHFAYEMVALSPRTAVALGIPVGDEDADRQFVEMSGRRGYGVKADDLLDELTRRAVAEVDERNPELPDDERERIGRQIAVGAARYFLLRFSRNTVIVFDLDEALAFEGETGPYLQYAGVRAGRIFDRLRSDAELDPESVVDRLLGDDEEGRSSVAARLASDDGELWTLLLALSRLDEVVEQATRSLEIGVLAKYAFSLAQHFNRFYHGYPILQAEEVADRELRILVADVFARQLSRALELLGIPVPERM